MPGSADLMVNPAGTIIHSMARLWEEAPMCIARKPRGEDLHVCVKGVMDDSSEEELFQWALWDA